MGPSVAREEPLIAAQKGFFISARRPYSSHCPTSHRMCAIVKHSVSENDDNEKEYSDHHCTQNRKETNLPFLFHCPITKILFFGSNTDGEHKAA